MSHPANTIFYETQHEIEIERLNRKFDEQKDLKADEYSDYINQEVNAINSK